MSIILTCECRISPQTAYCETINVELTDTILREAVKLYQELIFPTLHSSDA